MSEAERQTMKERGAAARRFVRSCDSGALATLSQRHAGHPFGSVAVFSLDREARPLIVASRLAEHSRNLKHDPRASLLLRAPHSDPLSDARVTLLAQAVEHTPDRALLARHLRQVPGARELLGLGDFYFVLLQPLAVRYIGGFGAVHWIEPHDYAPPACDIPEAEPELLDAITAGQRTELLELCRRRGREPAHLDLIGIDSDGLDLRADGVRLRFDFEQPVSSAADAPRAVSALAASAR
jgi:putative heme iron utilization protein